MSSIHSADKAEPNMVPILDMVFQLITFFMLVVNFKSADVDTSLALPVVGSARPADTKGQGELLVLNINSQGKLMVRGHEEADVEGFIKKEVQLLTFGGQKDLKPEDITVVIRADQSTSFRLLMRVVRACQAQSYRKFDFMVMQKAREG
jgi:biopolymer transport protein ExbD